jgi:hypothetical protein
MKKTLFAILLVTTLGFPFLAHADVPPFQPIVPIPNITTVDGGVTFSQYVNEIFKISISLGAMLAVLMIVYGGFEYMTSEALGGKKGGLSKIQNAFLGLLLLVSVVIILQIINPCILEISVFTREGGTCSPPTVAPALTNATQSGGTGGFQLRNLIPPGLFPGTNEERTYEGGLTYSGEGGLRATDCAGPIVDLCMPTAAYQAQNPNAVATARTGADCPDPANYSPIEACVAKVDQAVNLGTGLQSNQMILAGGAPVAMCTGMTGTISNYCCSNGTANCTTLAEGVSNCTSGSLTRVCSVPPSAVIERSTLAPITCATASTRYCCTASQCARTTQQTCPVTGFSQLICTAPQ